MSHATLIDERPDGFRGVFRGDFLARSLYAEAAGIARLLPSAVAVPADVDDVSTLVRWAARGGVALTARGSGSSMAGGALGPGVVVDLSRFASLGEVDVDGRWIHVGTGALRGAIDATARRHGLRFPVDPSSGAFCTIGGMIAANAAGARTLRYGATRPWVRALRCVFDDGQIAWIRRDAPLPMEIPAVARLSAMLESMLLSLRGRTDLSALRHRGVRKESSGYGLSDALAPNGHLLDLLVGSEGTLALFVEAELMLCPIAGATATVLASFPSLERATSCAIGAREFGASACELLDRTFLEVAASDRSGGLPAADVLTRRVPDGTEAVLLIEVEGEDASATGAAVDQLARDCRRHGALEVATAIDEASEHRLWALRHAASPILARLAPRLRSMQFIEDGCVPPEHFPAYVRGVRDALNRYDMPGVIFGHAGDAHAHVNPLVDVTRIGWRDRVRHLLDDVCALTAQLGGTMSGEHGDGRLRAPLWSRVWSTTAQQAFVEVKRAGDPTGIFNVGCKVARDGAQPIDQLRYDPEAPAIDPSARATLDLIERTRSWHHYRLDGVPPVT